MFLLRLRGFVPLCEIFLRSGAKEGRRFRTKPRRVAASCHGARWLSLRRVNKRAAKAALFNLRVLRASARTNPLESLRPRDRRLGVAAVAFGGGEDVADDEALVDDLRAGAADLAADAGVGARADPGIRSEVGSAGTQVVDKGLVVRDILAAPEGDGRDAQAAIPGA